MPTEKEMEKKQIWYDEDIVYNLEREDESLMPTIAKEYLHPTTNTTTTLNFNDGFAAECLDTIIQSNDIYQARERIRKRQEVGSSIKKRLAKFQKFAAGNHIKASTNRLGKDTLEPMIECYRERERLEEERIDGLHVK